MNHFIPSLLFILLLGLQTSCQAQTLEKKGLTASENNEIQNLIFTEVWVWEYKNEWIPANEPGHEGEVAIYYHPEKNYWLFTSEAYGISGEMTDWVIGKPNGEYISQTTDEFEHKNLHRDTITFHNYENLNEHLISLGATMSFGNPKMGFPLIQGEKYKVKYLKTNDHTTLYLGEVQVDMQSIYYFNQLISEAKLPVFFMTNLPKNKIILSDSTISLGKKTNFKFKYISPTEYHVQLTE